MTTTRTNSKGQQEVIADMPYPHLVNAHKRAVSAEERKHTHAAAMGEDYSNNQAEAEIVAMAAEIAKRDEAFAKANAERENLIACYESGQVSEAAWEEHLAADPALAAQYQAR